MTTRYIVHGTEPGGTPVRKYFEATSAGDAERQATALGVRVQAVEIDPAGVGNNGFSGGEAPRSSGGRGAVPMGPEQHVWTDTPSQWPNAGWFALGVLVLPLPWAIWKYVSTRCTKLTLTTERLRIQSGVFSKVIEEVELYRVKDTELTRSFWQRLVGLGTISLVTSDATAKDFRLANIKDAEQVRELIRGKVEIVRRARGVRELDVADNPFS